jgi:OHCU decarboxylase
MASKAVLLQASDEIWGRLTESDWMEAFRGHPRIGESRIGESRIGESGIDDSKTPKPPPTRSAAWSEQEQQNVTAADDAVKFALAEGNHEYEERFERTFIVCATGKSPDEILWILHRRLKNDERTEVKEAAEQQREITQIRLRRWLQG